MLVAGITFIISLGISAILAVTGAVFRDNEYDRVARFCYIGTLFFFIIFVISGVIAFIMALISSSNQ